MKTNVEELKKLINKMDIMLNRVYEEDHFTDDNWDLLFDIWDKLKENMEEFIKDGTV